MSAKNFKNQDLTGQNFDGQDLSYSLFRGANLTNCSFVNAKLHGINLRETTIENCNFTNAEMFYCNSKDAVGTANWTNAKVYGMAKWIPMPGADETTLPTAKPQRPVNVANIRNVYIEAISQAGLTIQNVSEEDRRVLLTRKGEVSGPYANVPHGRKLYEVIGDPNGTNETSLEHILNLCIEQRVKFNTDTQEFYK